jgi:serine protease AprX
LILQHKTQYRIRIVNLSLGRPVVESCAKDPLCQAVESLNAAGLVVVVSAGNWGARLRLGDLARHRSES